MLVLALDTFSMNTGVVLWRDGNLLCELSLNTVRNRDISLAQMTQTALGYTNLTLEQVDGIVISRGPGSFTGLRVGAAYAKGICYALNKPLVAVSSFEALTAHLPPLNMDVMPIIYARGDEVYYAVFKFSEGKLNRVSGETIDRIENVLLKLTTPTLLLGSGVHRHWNVIRSKKRHLITAYCHYNNEPTARNIAQIGSERLKNGDIEDIYCFEPDYLQNFPR